MNRKNSRLQNMDQNSSVPPIFFVLAVGKLGEFGTNKTLPWPRIPEDMRHFRTLTTETKSSALINVVIMGWNTWESIGSSPLPYRVNFVLTSRQPPDNEEVDGVIFVSSIDACYEAITHCSELIETVYIIGGVQIIDAFLDDDIRRKRIYGAFITYIDEEFPTADVLFDVEKLEHRYPVVVDESSTMSNLRFVFRQ